MKNFSLLIILLLTVTAIAQKDTLAKYTNAELIDMSDMDITKAKVYSKEVLKRNPSDSIIAEASTMISIYYIRVDNDYKSAIQYSEKSLDYAKKANYREYILEGLSRLMVYYAILDNTEEVFALLAEQKKYSLEENYELYNYEGLIYYILGDFKKYIHFNKKKLIAGKIAAGKNLSQEEHNNAIISIENAYVALANGYNFKKQLDSASFYIKKAEKIDKGANNTVIWHVKAFNLMLRKDFDGAIAYMDKIYEKSIKNFKIDIYQYSYYKAVCYQQKGDYQKGLDFAKEAIENKIPMITFQNYELECYKVAADCSEKLGKSKDALAYNKKYTEASQKINYAKKAAFMAKLYEQNDIDPLKEEIEEKSSNIEKLFWGLGFASIFAGYLLFRIAKSRREKKKFLAIIERLENNSKIKAEPLEELLFLDDFESVEETNAKKNISPETESKILKKLENFERKQRFLESNISLGALALEFNTNTTYITYVIKKHKNENLINYVNKLRIEYIIQKMASNPEYANYKIEYLAQESGFASYGTFKRIFTKETGIDPSKFINYLKQSN